MYLTNEDLEAALLAYRADPDSVANRERLGTLFLLLARNVATAWRASDARQEEFAAAAAAGLWRVSDRWVPEKGRAFGYFTSCCFNHMRCCARLDSQQVRIIEGLKGNHAGFKRRKGGNLGPD